MVTFNFDELIERRSSGSNKWNRYQEDVIPLWVADMDFRSPPAVLEALHERVNHGLFGYGSQPSPELVGTVQDWLHSTYNWQIDSEWIVWLPGLVCGLNVTARAIGKPDDQVMTATPVYFHLFKAPGNVDRESLSVPLAHDRERNYWSFDVDRMEQAITRRTSLFMLCNPHNPVGRVYQRDELLELAAFCERHNLVLCSDEIHCQLVLEDDQPHIPIAALDPDIAARTITLMAPSKTYNIPGLGCAFAIIPDPQLRKQFAAAKAGIVPHVNVLGYAATLAAYRDSGPWLNELITYLRANRDWLHQAVNELPGVTMSPLAATYLAWLDFRDTPIDDPGAFFLNAGVALSNGNEFGSAGFCRLNFACPRETLERAFARMKSAFEMA